MPHHLIVKPIIEQTYKDLESEFHPEIIIISPDHFHQGATHITTPPESEFGFTIHRDYALTTWPDTPITGYMVQNEATQQEVDDLLGRLAKKDALFIFSIDFSHYLPGDVAYVHDQRSMDILRSRDVNDARSIEADSPTALEIMLKLLEIRGEILSISRNTNPSLDSGITTFENTTHIFARSELGTPSPRSLQTLMYFAHPQDWYLGKTQEDRYLYGYDQVFWDQGGSDHAVIEDGVEAGQTFSFSYFD